MKMADLRKKATTAYRKCQNSPILALQTTWHHYSWISHTMRENLDWLHRMMDNGDPFCYNLKTDHPGNKEVRDFIQEATIYYHAKKHGIGAALLFKLSLE